MLPGRGKGKVPTRTLLLSLITAGTVLLLIFRLACRCPPPTCPPIIPPTIGDATNTKLVAFVGVMTGFVESYYLQDPDNYMRRRAALRKTWFPASKDAHQALLEQGIVARFVLGQAGDYTQEQQVATEVQQFDDFLRLPSPESYGGLPFKVLTFLRAVMARYNPVYVFKVDDDIYLRLDRVPPVVEQWMSQGADYIGCMKQGEVFSNINTRWYEPQHSLLGGQYFTHVWGSSYVVSGRAAAAITTLPVGLLRFFANEDTTVGSWMLAFNLTHKDDRRLCETECTTTSISVWDYPTCAGLCKPVAQLQELHGNPNCHLPAVDAASGSIAETWHHFTFEAVPQLG